MGTRAPGAPFDTLNVVIGRQGRYELTLSFRPDPYLSTLLVYFTELDVAHKVGAHNFHTMQAFA